MVTARGMGKNPKVRHVHFFRSLFFNVVFSTYFWFIFKNFFHNCLLKVMPCYIVPSVLIGTIFKLLLIFLRNKISLFCLWIFHPLRHVFPNPTACGMYPHRHPITLFHIQIYGALFSVSISISIRWGVGSEKILMIKFKKLLFTIYHQIFLNSGKSHCSRKSISDLKPILLQNMLVPKVHYGNFLACRMVTEPIVISSKLFEKTKFLQKFTKFTE